MTRAETELAVALVGRIARKPAPPSPDLDAMLARWDELHAACQAILCAQPRQMTEAAARLDAARALMRDAIAVLALGLMDGD